MSGHDIIVIGGSAGGLRAIRQLLLALPRDLPAACCAVLHLPSDHESSADRILQGAGTMRGRFAEDGEEPAPTRAQSNPGSR